MKTPIRFLAILPAILAGADRGNATLIGPSGGGVYLLGSVAVADMSPLGQSPGVVTKTVKTSYLVTALATDVVPPPDYSYNILFKFDSYCYDADAASQFAYASMTVHSGASTASAGCNAQQTSSSASTSMPVSLGVPFVMDITLSASARYDLARGSGYITFGSPFLMFDIAPISNPEPSFALPLVLILIYIQRRTRFMLRSGSDGPKRLYQDVAAHG